MVRAEIELAMAVPVLIHYIEFCSALDRTGLVSEHRLQRGCAANRAVMIMIMRAKGKQGLISRLHTEASP